MSLHELAGKPAPRSLLANIPRLVSAYYTHTPDASDPDHRVPSVSYRPVLDGYSSQRPVDPSPWVERNRQVTPTPEKGGQ